jgi:hypothetical protein
VRGTGVEQVLGGARQLAGERQPTHLVADHGGGDALLGE